MRERLACTRVYNTDVTAQQRCINSNSSSSSSIKSNNTKSVGRDISSLLKFRTQNVTPTRCYLPVIDLLLILHDILTGRHYYRHVTWVSGDVNMIKSSLVAVLVFVLAVYDSCEYTRHCVGGRFVQLSQQLIIITALHGMQTRSCDEISVCPSVCPSVKRVHCDKTGEKSIQIFIPCERSFCLVLWEEEWLVGATPSIWNFVSTGPRWSEIAHFKPIIAHSALAVRPSEKSSINTNRKSTTCFGMSLRWTSHVVPKPPNGG